MNIRGDVGRSEAMRRWLSHLVLFVFIARSFIPVGFMPDFAGASAGAFRIVICTGYGPQILDLDVNGHKLPPKSGGSHHQPCAFSASNAVADLYATGITVAPSDNAVVVARHRIFDTLPPVRAGPHLGSRGPPAFS
ncbi:hypothetical protein [Hyphomicrobium sp. 2TAF46]|uniref:hypothetical protein n=1 Tax=Hyphomicrobium sp. 2TAF46 TaxID=3233019 RepID=UPI003F93E37F